MQSELKAQVSFFWSSVVRLPSVCQCQFKPNLTRSILWWRGFKFVQMKGTPFPCADNKYIVEIHNRKLKSSSLEPEPLDLFKPNSAQSILGWRKFRFDNEGPRPFPKGNNNEIVKIHWRNLKFSPEPLHGPILSKHRTKHPWVKGI